MDTHNASLGSGHKAVCSHRAAPIFPAAERFAPRPGEGPPVYVRFYFFNITNLEGVHAGEKPILVRAGVPPLQTIPATSWRPEMRA
jgi:hypothetical protein